MTSYEELYLQAEALLQGDEPPVSRFSNLTSLLYHGIGRLNWIGYYLAEEEKGRLVLSAFQGKPACMLISFDRGVCGRCYRDGELMIVDDVHEFPGHIACDSESRSELVLPLKKDGRVRMLLDADSPEHARFGEAEREFFLRLGKLMEECLKGEEGERFLRF